jgi:Spy/CpxP family protein refolding chaperone
MSARTLALLLCFSAAFNIAFVGVWAYNRADRSQPPYGVAEPGNEPETPATVLSQFDLNDEQQGRIETERRELSEKVKELLAETDRARDRLFELLKAEEPDRQAIRDAQRRIGENQHKLRELAVEHMLNVTMELNPDQRQQLIGKMKQYADARGSRHGRFGRGRRTGEPSRWDRQPGEDEARNRPPLLDSVAVLTSPVVTVEAQHLPRGIQFHVRSDDPEAVRRIQNELPAYFGAIRRGERRSPKPEAYAPPGEVSQGLKDAQEPGNRIGRGD